MRPKKNNSQEKNILFQNTSLESRPRCEATPGYIYILSNPSYGNLYKVGKTTKDPSERAEELSSLTAVPSPFKVEYSVLVENCSLTEALTHKVLQERGYRLSENREFFNAPIKEIKKVIRKFNRKPVIPRAKQFKNQIKNLVSEKNFCWPYRLDKSNFNLFKITTFPDFI